MRNELDEVEEFTSSEPDARAASSDSDARATSSLSGEAGASSPSDEVEALSLSEAADASSLTIAVAKGRMQGQALELLAQAGVRVSDEALASRRLAVPDLSGRYRFVFVKPADVPVYVEHGIADCGFVGRDVLLESDADLLQPLDLHIARCRICVAAPRQASARPFSFGGALRVATKYPRIAAAHFGARGVPLELIELSGSVELAAVMGLADCIVDLVETGRTLEENGLEVVEEITFSTGRLVVNRASYQLKAKMIARLINALQEAVAQRLPKQ